MKLLPAVRTSRPGRFNRARVSLGVEQLDARYLLSVTGLAPLLEVEPNDTLDVAQQLNIANLEAPMEVLGTVGNGAAGAADVDWYSFNLENAAHVHLAITGDADTSHPVLGLYNSNGDPYDFSDPFTPSGHRLLAQTDEGVGEGFLDRDLPAGTYYAAVSGSGNRYFHPFLAGSGNDGQAGPYSLTVETAAIERNPDDGPAVLAFDSGAAGSLTSSPFVLRLMLDAPLDPGMVSPGANVRLLCNANGTFGGGEDEDVNLGGFNYSAGLSELQLLPAAPLKPGFYQLFLAGDASNGDFVLADPNGIPLGANAAHPLGQDYSHTFVIAGREGRAGTDAGADDTAPFAHDLGELAPESRLQATGAIGDDPYYDPSNPDPIVNPSADVDMYHFHISGPGRYAFAAEVFAGRIGSPADPGISLFQLDPATGQLVFLDGNNNSRNPALAANGTLPLHDDPALFFGLTEGDYYVAVTSNYNTPSSAEGGQPGANGIFDPNVSHSGTEGFSTGPYVLNFGIHRDDTAPEVVTTSLVPGDSLNAPPTELVVGFSETMNLRELIFLAYEQTGQETVSAVYIEGADGTRYFPRLESYDDATNQAHFLMLDGLAIGEYRLHLSGALGLTDLAGNEIAANDASGDYVVSFTVAGLPRGAAGDPLSWSTQESNDGPTAPQNLGILFPHELQSGVTITRDFTGTANGVADTADYYQVHLIQNQTYSVTLAGRDLPEGIQVTFTDMEGIQVPYYSPDGQALVVPQLEPGTYLVRVDGWQADRAAQVAYELRLELLGASDNAPALTAGPAPALRLRLVSSNQAAIPANPPQVAIPPITGDGPSASSAPGNGNIVLVSVQRNSVTLPPVSLQELASGPLGGVSSSSGSSTLASAETVAFRLPETRTSAVLLTSFAADRMPETTGDPTPIPGNEVTDTWFPPEAISNLLTNVLRPSRFQERIADRIFEMRNWWSELAANPESKPGTPLDSAVPSAEVAASQTRTLAEEQAASEANAAQLEVQSAAETDAAAVGDAVMARVACWIAGLAGFGLAWLLYRRRTATGPMVPPNWSGKGRIVNLEEAAS